MSTNNTMPTNLPYWIPAYYAGSSPSQYNAAMNPVIKDIGIFFPQNPSELPPLLQQIGSTMQGFDAQAQATVWAGLRTFEGIIDVKFTPSSSGLNPEIINFAKAQLSGTVGEGYTVRSYSAGAVLIKPGYAAPGSPGEGWLLSHELMHALGLKHPHEGTYKVNDQDNSPLWTGISNTTTDPAILTQEEILEFSYNGFKPRPLDIAALQYLYGPSKSVRTGDDTYVLVENNPNFVWDGVGTDTIDGQSLTRGLTLDLNPGAWGHIGAKSDHITAPGQVTVNYGSVIENVLGTRFDDAITGNTANNVFKGFDGNDRFTLASGNDTVDGGTGFDTVVLSGVRAGYVKSQSGAASVFTNAADGSKALTNVERVLFNKGANGSDGVAFDIANGGVAGDTIKLLGVLGGQALIGNKEIAGLGLHLRDAGLSRDQVSDLAINAVVGPNGTHADVVNLLWTNLMGSAPSTADRATFVDALNAGVFTRGSLTTAAADLMDQMVGLTGVGSLDFTLMV